MIEKYIAAAKSRIAFERLPKLMQPRYTMYQYLLGSVAESLVHQKYCNILMLGTGRGQFLPLLSHLLKDGTFMMTCDARDKGNGDACALLERWGNPNSDVFFISGNSDDQKTKEQVEHVLNQSMDKKIDLLVCDADNTRAQIKSDLVFWSDFLSDRSVILFTGAIWCHDSVKVLVDDIVSDYSVHRYCRNKDIKMFPNYIDDWDDSDTPQRGINPSTMRPYFQEKSCKDNLPTHALDQKLDLDKFHDSKDEFEGVDFTYELILTHPGSIILHNVGTKSWSNFSEKIHAIA